MLNRYEKADIVKTAFVIRIRNAGVGNITNSQQTTQQRFWGTIPPTRGGSEHSLSDAENCEVIALHLVDGVAL